MTASLFRAWSRRQLQGIPPEARDLAGKAVMERLTDWEPWRQVPDVAAFVSSTTELPTSPLLQRILSSGRGLWLPRVVEAQAGRMEMVPVKDLHSGLTRGPWGILEPHCSLASRAFPDTAIVLVPGLAFDLHGGRIGHGKGFYDRWLAAHPGRLRCGLAFDVQIHTGHLPLTSHDVRLDLLITERRLVRFGTAAVPIAPSTTALNPGDPS